ncbi:E3 ubiquitin-protein ligase RNF220-like [Macrobrachium rosenbergii]|uniref:E3 ubiquitin-protein ligase RNF220-like n=1 Tax=Macrobrachium rosenbergii TaxID=79674 RepID=UPI0034D6B7FA
MHWVRREHVTFGNGKKSSGPRESECPVCGITLRAGKVDAHLQLEISKLVRLPQSRPLSQRTPSVSAASPGVCVDDAVPSTSSSYTAEVCNTPRLKEKSVRKGADWQKYERIKCSRQARSREKRRRGTSADEAQEEGGGAGGERECPVCDKTFAVDEIERHITRCLRQAETEFEDEEVDVEGDEGDEYEEYEWCGVTRVRATTLLDEGQLHAIGTKVERGSEDEMVDVCDDDAEAFGPSQYTDKDLSSLDENDRPSNQDSDSYDQPDGLGNLTHSQESSNQLTSAVPTTNSTGGSELQPSQVTSAGGAIKNSPPSSLGDFEASLSSSAGQCITRDSNLRILQNKNTEVGIDTVNSPSSSVSQKDSNNECETDIISEENSRLSLGEDEGNDSVRATSQGGGVAVGVGGGPTMEALRARVRELEEERLTGRYSCRVCHGDYEKPVVSISCWHVHCETCWLHALAAKKLCPQCSVITSTSDLRRVYL